MPDPVTGLIAGGTTILGGMLASGAQSDAAGRAADSSERAAMYQADTQWRMYERSRHDMLPYIQAGHTALDSLVDLDPTAGAQDYLDNLMALTFPDTDPTGDMENYMAQLDALEFEFDPNDEVYQFRQAENTRRVNQFMASRGGYDSRAAANMLLQSGMQLEGEEIDRQFNQRYLSKVNKLTDLAKLSFQSGQAETQNALQRYTADVARNTTGFNAALTLGGARENQLLNLVKAGQGASGQMATMGGNTANALTQISQNNATNQGNALLAQGNAQADMWNTIGTTPANAMMMYQLFS